LQLGGAHPPGDAGLIRKVVVTDVENAPPKAALEDSSHAYWKNPKKWMRARLDVTVTHAAWLEHLEKGTKWDSRAFAVVSTYGAHPPIAPGEKAAPPSPDGGDEAFAWVPRECFLDDDETHGRLPALLRMPAYAPSAYTVTDKMTKDALDKKRLREWIGEPVAVDSRNGLHHGVLVSVDGTTAWIVNLEEGSKSGRRADIESIGRLVPKPGRRGTKLGYERILSEAATAVVGAKKSGRSLELTLRVPPDGRSLAIESASDVLHLLVAPLQDPSGSRKSFARSQLTTALRRDLAARDLEDSHVARIYPEIAAAYVASFELVAPRAAKRPRLNAMTSAEAKTLLAAPWPTATLRVVATDPAWIAHVDMKTPIVVHQDPYPKAAPSPRTPKPKAAVVKSPAPSARVVLVFQDKKSDKVWSAQRKGATWSARWGKRRDEARQEKTYALASEAAAIAAFDKAVAAKLKEKYRAAPTRDEATAIVWERLGLELDDAAGELVVIKVGPAARKHFKPKDRITAVWARNGCSSDTAVTLVEELAFAIAPIPKGTDNVIVSSRRPSTSRSGGTNVTIG
jgi:predicted DNA-binding WGR domain protein